MKEEKLYAYIGIYGNLILASTAFNLYVSIGFLLLTLLCLIIFFKSK